MAKLWNKRYTQLVSAVALINLFGIIPSFAAFFSGRKKYASWVVFVFAELTRIRNAWALRGKKLTAP